MSRRGRPAPGWPWILVVLLLPLAAPAAVDINFNRDDKEAPLVTPDEEDLERRQLGLQGLSFGNGPLFRPRTWVTRSLHNEQFPEIDARGFHESVFATLPDYYTMWKRSYPSAGPRSKKTYNLGISSRGFHDDVFGQNFGDFSTVKRSPRNYFADGYESRKKREISDTPERNNSFASRLPPKMVQDYLLDPKRSELNALENFYEDKRRQKDSLVFHGDTFNNGFGDFKTMKRKPAAFEGDVFDNGFGDFNTMKRGDSIFRSNQLNSGNSKLLFDDKFSRDYNGDFRTIKRRPGEILGFHGDTFDNGFGDFNTMKRRTAGFHGDVFDNNFGVFNTMRKRVPGGGAGLHADTFSNGFGDFNTMKRVPESAGLEKDTFTGGFGDFNTMKRSPAGLHADTFSGGFGGFDTMRRKRSSGESSPTLRNKVGKILRPKRASRGASGFHGDTFTSGFGDFGTMKRIPVGSVGFHGDTFDNGFGDFNTMKRRPGGTVGFHGDTFDNGFGDFNTMKRRPGGTVGFHGDTFDNGFGDFNTMKRASGAAGLHGDTFSNGFGDFGTMKRRPGGTAGFHGDTFDNGFGDFNTMKRALGAAGLHGDTFSNGFGDFGTMKRRPGGTAAFHADTFDNGFGQFSPMKRSATQGSARSNGPHSDIFSSGFGDFNTMKREENIASTTPSTVNEESNALVKRDAGLYRAGTHTNKDKQQHTIHLPPVKTIKVKRANIAEILVPGYTVLGEKQKADEISAKKRKAASTDISGDTFNGGFGDFNTMRKKRSLSATSPHNQHPKTERNEGSV